LPTTFRVYRARRRHALERPARPRAVLVNVAIMRAFVQLRRALATHEELRKKIELMERRYDNKFEVVFTAIKQMLQPSLKPKLGIGFSRSSETSR
jgi:hypothetical protein